MREEARRPEAVVERDDHGTLLREARAVVALLTTETGAEATTVNPHHHRPRCGGGAQLRRPDVQVEAVLGHTSCEGIDVSVDLCLHAVLPELVGTPDTGPARRSLRRTPAQSSHRRRCVGNTAEHD